MSQQQPPVTAQRVVVPRLSEAPRGGEGWRDATEVAIAAYHPRSSDHRPRVAVKLGHTGDAVHVRFEVEDRYVLARTTKLHGDVWRDSCVEFFVEPRPGRGYFNFELNAIGTMLLYHVRDHRRTKTGLADAPPVDAELAARIDIRTSLREPILNEIAEATPWWLELHIPLAVLEAHIGELGDLSGQTWRGNFNKCADATSHPHWGSWSPMGEVLEFHQPARFGEIVFA